VQGGEEGASKRWRDQGGKESKCAFESESGTCFKQLTRLRQREVNSREEENNSRFHRERRERRREREGERCSWGEGVERGSSHFPLKSSTLVSSDAMACDPTPFGKQSFHGSAREKRRFELQRESLVSFAVSVGGRGRTEGTRRGRRNLSSRDLPSNQRRRFFVQLENGMHSQAGFLI